MLTTAMAAPKPGTHYQGPGILITPPKQNIQDCSLITGTWKGYVVDQNKLFADGGPWPIKVTLLNHPVANQSINQVIGKIDAGNTPVNKQLSQKIWGECRQGKLQKLLLDSQNGCGADFIPKTGALLSGNILLLYLNWESPMIGTNFMLVLKRINSIYSYPVPQQQIAFVRKKMASCR